MATKQVFKQMLKRASLTLYKRGRVLRTFYDRLAFVHFGAVDQHDDEHSAIRGFTASLTHSDTHYAVGTYNGYDIRVVDRFDVLRIPGHDNHQQLWTIIEVKLNTRGLPHMFFVPTGREAGEYARLFATQPHLQPLNSMLGTHNHSPEFHGRYQILARPTHSHEVERLFSSPIIVGIGARFWPHGVEIDHDTLYVYITQARLTQSLLNATLGSALWLTEVIDESTK